MKNLFTISLYTIFQTIKKKSFIISNIIIAIFVVLLFAILSDYLSDISDQIIVTKEEAEVIPVVLIDENNIFGKYIYDIKTDPYLFVLISNEIIEESNQESEEPVSFEESVAQIEDSIRNDEINYAIFIEKNEEIGFSLKFLCKKAKNVNETEALLLSKMLNSIYNNNLLNTSGIDTSNLNFETDYSLTEIDDTKYLEGSYIIAMAVSILLFLAIYLYGHSIASSISSEKMSRIIETLVTSTKPRLIVLGKTIGMGFLGILQLLFLILVATISYKALIPANLDVVSEFLSTLNVSSSSIIILLVFFILGYLLYAFSSAVIGAIISKTEDLQIANMPLSLISLFSFYLSIFTINMPENSLSKIASYFPFSSAFSVPAKLFAGYINIQEVYISIIFLSVTVILVAFFAVRIYSKVILNYGNKLKFKDLL